MKITLHALASKKDTIKKFFWFLGTRAFPIMLLLIFLAIFGGVLLFYTYVISPNTQNQETIGGAVTFSDANYQQVLKEWNTKNQLFQGFFSEQFTNLFSFAAQNTPAPTNVPPLPSPQNPTN